VKPSRDAKVIPLARDSHVAMYRQLAQQLRGAITRGDYRPGDKIPTEPQLIRRFGVSRITARQAVDALAREKLVIRKQGKGTFVAGPLVHHDLLELRGIYDELVAQGLEPHTRLLELAGGPAGADRRTARDRLAEAPALAAALRAARQAVRSGIDVPGHGAHATHARAG
jgi:DNA-binding GntR family transcriptional regulator